MATAQDLIKQALRDIGAIASSETPTSDESNDALDSLNQIISDWSNDGYLVYDEKKESFSLTSGQDTYTIGDTGDFVTARPQFIRQATVRQNGTNTEVPLKIINQDEYGKIPDKTITSSIPLTLYYNMTYPNGTIYLYPVPEDSEKIFLYSVKILTSFSSLTTTISLPPGFERALRKNLALELSVEYGKTPSPLLLKQAQEALDRIRRVNTKPVIAYNEVSKMVGTNNVFDWRSGE